MFKWIKQLRCNHEYHVVDNKDNMFEFHRLLAKNGVNIAEIKQSWIKFSNMKNHYLHYRTECKKCNKFLCEGVKNG